MAYQGKRFTCTVFVDSLLDGIDALNAMPSWHAPGAKYGAQYVWGDYGGGQVERCPTTGNYHLQLWIGFEHNKRLNLTAPNNFFKGLHPTAHWEVMKGTIAQNVKYCSKSDTSLSEYITWGDVPVNEQGKRSELKAAIETLKSAAGSTSAKIRAVAEEHGEVYVKYYKGIERLAAVSKPLVKVGVPAGGWRPWQQFVLDILNGPVHSRRMWWFYDPDGGAGKSTLVRYACANMQACLLDGKVSDMAYAWTKDDYKIAIFDLVRALPDDLSHVYRTAEQISNGIMASPKFESQMVLFEQPHVIIMSNSMPDPTKWSADRYVVVDLRDPMPVHLLAPVAQPAVIDLTEADGPSAGGAAAGGAGVGANPFEDVVLSQFSLFN